MDQSTDEDGHLTKRRAALLTHIDEGTRQLRTGEFKEYGPNDLERFRADIIEFKLDTFRNR